MYIMPRCQKPRRKHPPVRSILISARPATKIRHRSLRLHHTTPNQQVTRSGVGHVHHEGLNFNDLKPRPEF